MTKVHKTLHSWIVTSLVFNFLTCSTRIYTFQHNRNAGFFPKKYCKNSNLITFNDFIIAYTEKLVKLKTIDQFIKIAYKEILPFLCLQVSRF